MPWREVWLEWPRIVAQCQRPDTIKYKRYRTLSSVLTVAAAREACPKKDELAASQMLSPHTFFCQDLCAEPTGRIHRLPIPSKSKSWKLSPFAPVSNIKCSFKHSTAHHEHHYLSLDTRSDQITKPRGTSASVTWKTTAMMATTPTAQTSTPSS